jgi:hypothetical protein
MGRVLEEANPWFLFSRPMDGSVSCREYAQVGAQLSRSPTTREVGG